MKAKDLEEAMRLVKELNNIRGMLTEGRTSVYVSAPNYGELPFTGEEAAKIVELIAKFKSDRLRQLGVTDFGPGSSTEPASARHARSSVDVEPSWT